MQREPIEFGAMNGSRAKRRALASKTENRREPTARLSAYDASPTIRDEAFAEYSPTASADATSDGNHPNNLRFVTRELIADISAQLETLDRQRRQLARLLETVEHSSIAD